MALKLIRLVKQLTDQQIPDEQPMMDAQLVEVDKKGGIIPITPQRRFVLEFNERIGELETNAKTDIQSASGDSVSVAQYNELVTAYNNLATLVNKTNKEFNELIKQLDYNELVQRP